jgi:hypothetical protein
LFSPLSLPHLCSPYFSSPSLFSLLFLPQLCSPYFPYINLVLPTPTMVLPTFPNPQLSFLNFAPYLYLL